ncbi:MAG: hypothetical protein MRY72_00890, partial [Aquisalinus sp.]|nr:hypothetical protein [Aquisalinus sp.]
MKDWVNVPNYSGADVAGTYRKLQPGPERSSPEIDADFETLMRDGYVIIENLIPRDTCEEIK